jgi:hypothetical protein
VKIHPGKQQDNFNHILIVIPRDNPALRRYLTGYPFVKPRYQATLTRWSAFNLLLILTD